MNEVIKIFSKEDFNTEEPYKLLYDHRDDGFSYMQLYNQIEENASDKGFKRFGKMISAYFQQHQTHGGHSVINNMTDFINQPIELYSGDWMANEQGIMKRNMKQGMDIACVHPILPVQRLVNIDDGTVRLKIAFKRHNRKWIEVIANKSMLFSAREIKKLADNDVSVSDINASYLVQYLQEIEDLNHDTIPEKQSVGHLGWISNGLFSPYMKDIEFDGIGKFKSFFNAVQSNGSYDLWLAEARKVRKTDSPARIALAASFASVLLKVIGKLNFMVHFFGGSEVGKTVGLLLATSVWANPNEDGGFMQTFNGTAVGLELQAGFVNNLPLILDEFQLIKDKKSFEYSVYMLCEGIGKTRGAKTGGLQDTATWKNCTITSGEHPITFSSTGGGAINRIIEIECKEKLFEDAPKTLDVIRSNYGHAGKVFITLLDSDEAKEEARALYKQFYQEIGAASTEKQTMAAAIILTADALATKWIFCDNNALKVSDIEKYLHTKESVDINRRAFNYLIDFCISNAGRFKKDADPCFGVMVDEEIKIIGSRFEEICEDGGFNAKSLISWLDSAGMLMKGSDDRLRKSVNINGHSSRCVCIDMQKKDNQGFMMLNEGEDTPFS